MGRTKEYINSHAGEFLNKGQQGQEEEKEKAKGGLEEGQAQGKMQEGLSSGGRLKRAESAAKTAATTFEKTEDQALPPPAQERRR